MTSRIGIATLLAFGFALSERSAYALRFTKGPYLQNVSRDAITVMWETDEPAPGVVQWGPTTEYGTAASSPEATLHEVRLQGLEPSAIYHYRVVVGDGLSSRDRRFTTAANPTEPFRFLLYGDNRDDHGAHAAVVESMLAEHADLAFNTGDMVGNGASEGEWQIFFDVEKRLLAETTMFPVIGNHEAHSATGRELFRRYFSVPDDTVRPEEDYAVTIGNSRFIILTAYAGFPADQLEWVRNELATSQEEDGIEHRFVFIHHGLYSSGYHGPNVAAVEAGLGRLLQEGEVDLLVSGHDHEYERGRSRGGLRYIVSGGGGAPLYDVDTRQPYEEVFEAALHYVRVDVVGDSLEITAIRPDGSVIDRCRTRAREAWDCQTMPQAARGRAVPTPPVAVADGCPGTAVGAAVPIVALAIVGLAARLRRKRESGSGS